MTYFLLSIILETGAAKFDFSTLLLCFPFSTLLAIFSSPEMISTVFLDIKITDFGQTLGTYEISISFTSSLRLGLSCVYMLLSHPTCEPMDWAHQVPLSMWFPSKNTGVGFHAFLQGIFPTQGLNPMFLISRALADGFFTTVSPGFFLEAASFL